VHSVLVRTFKIRDRLIIIYGPKNPALVHSDDGVQLKTMGGRTPPTAKVDG
jgi:hypothetical protein